ncbi:hypothetical protein [Paenibacillus sp. OK003]|uniref:hypothetical protein n=1 Tax=Paenibacillus sp. OK003 TaxID=1884380 RepID=UPI001C3130B2|nr:hypothetical protein [Paenibacillus sp. OK003]
MMSRQSGRKWSEIHSYSGISFYECGLTEYSLGKEMIYAAFAWSVAEDAYKMMHELARQHNVGFFDVNGSDGKIIRL